MTDGPPILLLAGARETQQAAQALNQSGVDCCAPWAKGAEEDALCLPVLADFPPRVAGVLDATHAFDTQTRAAACAALQTVPYARFGRDPWAPTDADNWHQVDGIDAAVAALPSGARVFAATGRGSLPALARHDGPVFLRQLSRHDAATGHDNCTYVFGAAPFAPAGEAALFRKLDIDVVLARNIGGQGSFPKLMAARMLGLPVVLLRPPPLPQGPHLRSADDVANWVRSL